MTTRPFTYDVHLLWPALLLIFCLLPILLLFTCGNLLYLRRPRFVRRRQRNGNRRSCISEVLPAVASANQADDSRAVRDFLLAWCRSELSGYGISVNNFTTSWRDGRAFMCLIHRYRPDLADPDCLSSFSNADRLARAFDINERELGVPRLLEPEDVDTPNADELSLITYLSALYDSLADRPLGGAAGAISGLDLAEETQRYRREAGALAAWLQRSAAEATAAQGEPPSGLTQARAGAEAAQKLLAELTERTESCVPDLRRRYERLTAADAKLYLEHTLRPDHLARLAERTVSLATDRRRFAELQLRRLERLHRLAEAARGDIVGVERRLARLADEERRLRRLDEASAVEELEKLLAALNSEGDAVNRLFERVQHLRDERYGRAEQLYHGLCGAHLAYLELHRLVDGLAGRLSRCGAVLTAAAAVVSRGGASAGGASGDRDSIRATTTVGVLGRVDDSQIPEHRRSHQERRRLRHYDDVASVSRAFSTSPEFSPIRRCMGRLRELREQLERVDAAEMLASVAPAVPDGADVQCQELRRRVAWQNDFCRSAVDSVAEAEACRAIVAGLSEADRPTYAALLTELDAAGRQLTAASDQRLRRLEAWLAFAEAADEEFRWLEASEAAALGFGTGSTTTKALRFTDLPDVDAYLKSCLKRLQATMSDLEARQPRFNAVLTSGTRLARRCSAGGGHPAEGTVRRLEERWAGHLNLASCVQHQAEATAAAAAHLASVRRLRAVLADAERRLNSEFLAQQHQHHQHRPSTSASVGQMSAASAADTAAGVASRLRAIEGMRETLEKTAAAEPESALVVRGRSCAAAALAAAAPQVAASETAAAFETGSASVAAAAAAAPVAAGARSRLTAGGESGCSG